MSTKNTSNHTQLPAGTRAVLVFDTNAYIDLAEKISIEECRSRADGMRNAANQRGEVILASPTVIWELLAHLADNSDPGYDRCLKALVFLAHHSAAWGVDDHRLQCAPFGSALTCHALYGRAADSDTQNAQALSQMAYHVRMHAPDLNDPAFSGNAAEFARQMDRKEQAWVLDMQRLGSFNSAADPQALQQFFADAHFWPLYSREIVDRHASSLSVVQSEVDAQGRSDFLRETFEASYRLFAGLMSKLIAPAGINVESKRRKWWNFIWDEDLCWMLGPNHAIGNAPVRFVTTDRAFHTAAAEASCTDRVMTLASYRTASGGATGDE